LTSAELKTIREACGLSQEWLAVRAQVNQRTVRYWESGKSSVPDDVAALISGIDDTLQRAALEGVEQARRLILAHGAPKAITLFRYADNEQLWAARKDMAGLPASCHAALVARVRRMLIDDGQAVEVHWA
jgi:transcriptional regulator with XRE-family HTH domain